MTHRSYLLPAAVALATPGVALWSLFALAEQTASSVLFGATVLLPFAAVSAFALLVALILSIRLALERKLREAGAAAGLLTALVLALLLSLSASLPLRWAAVAFASFAALASAVWLGRLAFAPLPSDAANREQAI